MNPVIDILLNHRSIRDFEDQPLTDAQVLTIVESAQAASTSSYIQAYSIIGVTDREKKRQLAELAGNQAYVEENGHFFIFCADLHRHEVLAQMEGVDISDSLESTEKFMVAVIDASLAAQNASIAAESMGLGICYIGGIRNNLEKVNEVLKLPNRVIPLFGLAVGYPKSQSSKKPRLAFEHVYHQEEYEQNQDTFENELKKFNEVVSAYYNERTNGKRKDTWTSQMANMLKAPTRMYMKLFVEQKGFNKK
jgi:FMN reductase (NADPH)